MTSWRTETSPDTQADLDGLLAAVLPLAEQTLARHGDLFPFAARVDPAGDVALVAADPGHGAHPEAAAVLTALRQALRDDRDAARAAGVVCAVEADAATAVLVVLEHRDGTTLEVLAPYRRSRLRRVIRLAELTVRRGTPDLWV